MWLKAKGDDFFHAKDFASAIHAYTDALNAGPRHDTVFLATCVSNRAACLLASGNFEVRGRLTSSLLSLNDKKCVGMRQ